MGRPTFVLSLAIAGLVASGCKPKTSPTPPARVTQTKPRSTLLPEADRLMDAMERGEVSPIRDWMTPELRGRVRLDQLEGASLRLRTHFGNMLGILEEKVHREGHLRWYSGLVLYGTRAGSGVLTPVLYQFALTPDGALTRLQVREHWFVENLREPTDAYMPVNRFHFPADGQWTVVHGGPRRATNYHHGSRSQRYAYDIVVKKNGRQKPAGSAKTNNAYYCYGKTLRAPASGVVVRAINDVPENRPGERGRAGGNGLVIDHGFGEFSALWHMIPGSVKVKAGDRVEVGQPIGRVGNSGRSTMPHIHFHVNSDDGGRPIGLPAAFVEVYVNDRWRPRALPVRGDEVRNPTPKKKRTATRQPRVFVDV
jgi:murein DD-endopeptidase MepM/ murein hydrolase activator NlpD